MHKSSVPALGNRDKQSWSSLPAKLPGYNMTLGQLAKMLREYVSNGDFVMTHYYLNLFVQHNGMADLNRLSKAAGFFR